ncbi:MAG: Crp/Fnr family transcriptional regulator [Chloroflexi bacterium]|nr:Crp/Fnr family transcriptional regulator [Chloroflexota bacterium]
MLDIVFLRRVDYFRDLTEADLRRLLALAVELRLTPGQVLFLEGEACRGMYLVYQGRVRVYKASPEGREQVLTIAREGQSFAEVPVFDGGPNPASADAMEPSIAYLFPKDDLIALVRSSPEIALAVIRIFAQRLRHLTRLIEDLSFRQVTSRVAKLLLQSAREPGDGSQRLTQQEMAAMIGTAREVVARSLRTLEQQGAIQVQRGQVVIIQPELLERLV